MLSIMPLTYVNNMGRRLYTEHSHSEGGAERYLCMLGFEQASDIKWASRWDTYLLMTDDQIHWFSIINSLMIVLFLTGMVAMIMMRTLRRDISQYNELESAEEAQEETGWKLVCKPRIPFLPGFPIYC